MSNILRKRNKYERIQKWKKYELKSDFIHILDSQYLGYIILWLQK